LAQDPLQAERCAQLLKALSEPDRLRIVQVLRKGTRNVTELSEELHEELVNVSHHLNVLRNAGLVESRKQGRFVLYTLAPGLLQIEGGEADHLDLGCCRLELPDSKGS
jgi:ArsR family transcriptional regulator, nickel/cobalt-responsive transcriptional repressor